MVSVVHAFSIQNTQWILDGWLLRFQILANQIKLVKRRRRYTKRSKRRLLVEHYYVPIDASIYVRIRENVQS